ncbi:sigma factor-like helix-turn-helix DNA-binding protein [Bacillus subtilis]
MTARALPAAAPADESEGLALSVLTAAQAVVIRLKFQGLSDARIARRLGRSETAIWKRKHAAGRRLRALALAG